jgi:RNA polymerase-binding transcription factor DksA
MPRNDTSTVTWHRELLQRRLQKIDHALDRLMSGSYGNCSRCGDYLDQIKLDLDPAIAFCSACWEREQARMQDLKSSDLALTGNEADASVAEVAIETLNQFDTIVFSTRNSVYRAMLLDPETGRALVEGGQYLTEPKEACLSGAILRGDAFKLGSIMVGYRLEMWVEGKMMLTSPVESVRVEHHAAAESLEDISSAI